MYKKKQFLALKVRAVRYSNDKHKEVSKCRDETIHHNMTPMKPKKIALPLAHDLCNLGVPPFCHAAPLPRHDGWSGSPSPTRSEG